MAGRAFGRFLPVLPRKRSVPIASNFLKAGDPVIILSIEIGLWPGTIGCVPMTARWFGA